ncbi:MAG: transglutaminase domain-containing protein [Bacteroidales bacterium]|nr:transglutaminase domain-containing protein [Bacteroidales bacterium]
MKTYLTLTLFFIFLITTSCTRDDHFISEPGYRQKVREQFKKQKDLAKHRSDTLFAVFNENLSTEEQEALEFLFAYMSLNDLADYNGEFFLKNVKSSLAARDTFSWGKVVPEEIFRHFVLPIRVNNENLDSCRWVFFAELKDRIKGMSMKEAALEVNHWCHEKVTYKGTDGRTSSPLATVKTAFGRCGEESTFTTAALRAVGIPARQCYTPRWAHGDDNHAWVEVWIDSAWHYMGACEPEPDLDLAWFTAPAKRAMLVNTNVFGDYTGPEDVLLKDERYTRINILPNYTETKRIWARILDIYQQPIPHAVVEFQLYNYAEFYPLLKTKSDEKGLASLLTGYGDLLIWATKSGKYGFARADIRSMDTVNVYLELTTAITGGLNFDFTPPIQQEVSDQVDESPRKVKDVIARNEVTRQSERLKFEDQLRASYEATFIDSSKAYRLAATLELDPQKLWHYLHRSRGNWRELIAFIADAPDSLKKYVFPLLEAISEKDLRDINPGVLTDAISSSPQSPVLSHQSPVTSHDLLVNYIMNPRIDNELLKPYHSYLKGNFQPGFIENARENPDVLINWVKTNLIIDENANYSRAPITPAGVYELKIADPHSRDIFFVAVCRSFGIPARLEPATKVPQYYQDDQWKDVFFETPPAAPDRNATLVLKNDPENSVTPEYNIHFTVEQHKDGFYRTLDYENSELVKKFPVKLQLVPGTYLVVSGNRLSDGTVLARIVQIKLDAGKTMEIPLTLRKDFTPPPVFGSFIQSKLQTDLAVAGININPATGLVMAWLEPDKEPTKHFVSDLKKKAGDIEQWQGKVILFLKDQKEMDQFSGKEKQDLPGNVIFELYDAFPFDLLYHSLDVPLSDKYPVVIYINPKGIINFFSEGYRIGTGEELVKLMKR